VFVDGIAGDVGVGVLRDRRVLAEEGVVVAIVTVDGRSGEIVGSPEIVSRGFLDEPGSEAVVEELRRALVKVVEAAAGEGGQDPDALRRLMRRTVGRIVSDRTRRRPMILAVVLEGLSKTTGPYACGGDPLVTVIWSGRC
jgi:ribonuclease J